MFHKAINRMLLPHEIPIPEKVTERAWREANVLVDITTKLYNAVYKLNKRKTARGDLFYVLSGDLILKWGFVRSLQKQLPDHHETFGIALKTLRKQFEDIKW